MRFKKKKKDIKCATNINNMIKSLFQEQPYFPHRGLFISRWYTVIYSHFERRKFKGTHYAVFEYWQMLVMDNEFDRHKQDHLVRREKMGIMRQTLLTV